MSWGLSMNGLGDQIAEVVNDVRKRFDPLTYLEIGVANGETLCSVAKLIGANGKAWRAVGVELPSGYSFHREQVDQNCTGQHLTVGWIEPRGWNRVNPVWNRISVVLTDSRDFFEGMWQDPIHLSLIDACHCKECVMRDFLNIERYVPEGGTVMFHDFDPSINDPQPHGGHCDVVGACKELGLLEKRESWMLPRVLVADKSAGGANILAVTKESQ